MVLHGEGRVWGHKSVQLPGADEGDAAYRSAFVRHSPTYSDVPHAAPRRPAPLRPRRQFPLYSGREGGELCQITTANFGKSGRPDHFIRVPSNIRLSAFFLQSWNVEAFPCALKKM